MRVNEPQGDEDSFVSFVMIDQHGDVAMRTETETRKKFDEEKAADGHSVDLSLKDYVVVDNEIREMKEMKEKARMEYEQKKSKMAAVEDIEQKTKDEMRQRYEEEMKSGIDEGGVQRKNRIEAQKRKLKSDGEFFMKCLKASSLLHTTFIIEYALVGSTACLGAAAHCIFVGSHTSCYHVK